jgi:hypothetical protein
MGRAIYLTVYSTFIGFEAAMFFSPHHRWNFNSKTHTDRLSAAAGLFPARRIDSAQRLSTSNFFFSYIESIYMYEKGRRRRRRRRRRGRSFIGTM